MRNSKTNLARMQINNTLSILSILFFILSINVISAQTSPCPGDDVNCGSCITTIYVSQLPVYESPNSGGSFSGDLSASQCANCVDNTADLHHCHKFKFILDEPVYPYIQIHVGQGNGCQGILHGAYEVYGNHKCDVLATSTASRTIIDFKLKGGLVNLFLCSSDHSKVSLCNVAKSSSPLAVGFTSLNIHSLEYTNVIYWNTFYEENNDYFIVERSIDFQSWENIGKVAGVGNSTTLNQYSFADVSPISLAYYRIKQVDYDGSYTYSEIAKIDRRDQDKVDIFPNPTNNKLNFIINQPGITLVTAKITDISGKECFVKTFTSDDAHIIDINELPNGSYLISILGEGISFVKKFVKIDEYH